MANIYFKTLSFTNFMSYEHAEVQLNRNGIVLIGGINNNPEDGAKSNGCGKSTIFNALSWCLTGETVGGATDVANIYLKGKTEVILEFDFDTTHYKITRTKNPSNLFIEINGENRSGKGIRDTSKLLAEYLPQLTSNLLNSVILLGQGLPQKFTNNTPAGRKDVLEKLSNSEFMIADLKDRLTNRKVVLENQKRSLEDSNVSKTALIQAGENRINQLKQEITLMPSKDTLISALETLKGPLTEAQSLYDQYKNQLAELTTRQSKEQSELNNCKDIYLKEYQNLELEDESGLVQAHANLMAQRSTLVRDITKFENVKDICPTCGQKLPDVHKIDTTDLKAEKVKIDKSIEDVNAQLIALRKRNEDLQESCKQKYESQMVELMLKVDATTVETKSINAKLQEAQIKVEALTRQSTDIESQITNLDKEIASKESRITELKEDIDKYTEIVYKNNIELTEIENRISINSKMLNLIKRDFRGYLLNNVISFIQDKAQFYAQEVFGTDKLLFELSGNNINISYDGKDYSCLSGGEKQKLDIIIQFALRDMLCTFLGFSSNILVLDEITDALDAEGVSKVFNLIGSHLADVEALYIISHHVDELEIPADDEIVIIKGDDKISRIV